MGPIDKIVIVFSTGFGIVVRCTIFHCDLTGVPVMGESMVDIVKSDTILDDVIDGDTFSSEFKSVFVSIGGALAGGGFAVIMSDTVFEGNRADCAGVGFGVKVPTVVNVISGDTAVKNVARAGGELTGKTVGVFAVIGVEVVVRITVFNQVIARPFTLRSGRTVSAKLQTGVPVGVGNTILDDVIVTADKNAVITGAGNLDPSNMPIVTEDL